MKISTLNFQGIFLRVKKIIHEIKDDPVLLVSNQEPSMTSKYPSSLPHILDTFLIERSTQNFQGIFLRVKKNIIHDVKDDPSLHVSDQEPSMSYKYTPSWPSIPDTLLIQISTWKFPGIFLGVYLDHPQTIWLWGWRPKWCAKDTPSSPLQELEWGPGSAPIF